MGRRAWSHIREFTKALSSFGLKISSDVRFLLPLQNVYYVKFSQEGLGRASLLIVLFYFSVFSPNSDV